MIVLIMRNYTKRMNSNLNKKAVIEKTPSNIKQHPGLNIYNLYKKTFYRNGVLLEDVTATIIVLYFCIDHAIVFLRNFDVEILQLENSTPNVNFLDPKVIFFTSKF